MLQNVSDNAELSRFVHEHPICVLYLTTPNCGVCKVLKPKLMGMLTERFPGVGFAQVDCTAAPVLAADMGVFTVPTLILFTDGRESLRKARSFGVEELAASLKRPYRMLYQE